MLLYAWSLSNDCRPCQELATAGGRPFSNPILRSTYVSYVMGAYSIMPPGISERVPRRWCDPAEYSMARNTGENG